ncbi:hypothetical protein KFK14_12725 [Sphingobium phenoxybenzoativorans]|uniref:Uncharacterized protein n=1 Tax=Sphingobium phenoxybenzoativorans TaxID=1592790 RepID=A0A975K321_9SPHN|nr:hypothetical protein [Sphingobium phenoxybenzoativorans]QUT04010.1 hypothetical protein KFK14_12725 [Sphingobium phenoxybenzoativorans]
MTTFTTCGKQVLRDGVHFADATDEESAAAIVAQFNGPPAEEPDPFADHKCWSAGESSKGWAVYHEPKPKKTEVGTSYGLRVPALLIFEGFAKRDQIAQRIADILNKHWEAANG